WSFYHPHAVALALAFAEDSFAYGFSETARPIVAKHDRLLTDLMASPEWSAVSAADQETFRQQALRFSMPKSKLSANEDYWGNPVGWVPALSLEANVALFRQEAEWAIRSIYVADWLNDLNKRQTNKVNALEAARSLLTEEIRKQEALLQGAVDQLPSV